MRSYKPQLQVESATAIWAVESAAAILYRNLGCGFLEVFGGRLCVRLGCLACCLVCCVRPESCEHDPLLPEDYLFRDALWAFVVRGFFGDERMARSVLVCSFGDFPARGSWNRRRMPRAAKPSWGDFCDTGANTKGNQPHCLPMLRLTFLR